MSAFLQRSPCGIQAEKSVWGVLAAMLSAATPAASEVARRVAQPPPLLEAAAVVRALPSGRGVRALVPWSSYRLHDQPWGQVTFAHHPTLRVAGRRRQASAWHSDRRVPAGELGATRHGPSLVPWPGDTRSRVAAAHL